jgi:hypothetical protein
VLLFSDVTQRWLVVTDVSAQSIGQIQGSSSQRRTPSPLKTGPIGCPETSTTTNKRCVTSRKREDPIDTEVKAWDHAKKWRYLGEISTKGKWLTNPKKMDDSPSLVRIQFQVNPLHIFPFYCRNTHFNVTFPSTTRCCKQYLYSVLSYNKAASTFLPTCVTIVQNTLPNWPFCANHKYSRLYRNPSSGLWSQLQHLIPAYKNFLTIITQKVAYMHQQFRPMWFKLSFLACLFTD